MANLSWEHVEKLEQLEVGVLYSRRCRPDDAVQGFVGHLHQRHQPHLDIAFRLDWLLKLKTSITDKISKLLAFKTMQEC